MWLGSVPAVLRDLDVAAKDAASKKFKNVIPERFIHEYASALEDHHKSLLAYRATFENISGIKDVKLYKKKCDFVEAAEDGLNETRKTLRAWKHTAHVFLQYSKK